MLTTNNNLFDLTVKLFKSFGANIALENGVLVLVNEIELSNNQALILIDLFGSKQLFRNFTLMIDWDDAKIDQILAGAKCTVLKIEFHLYKGNKFGFYKNEQDLFKKLSAFLIQGKSLPENYYFVEEDFRSDGELIRPSLIKLGLIKEWLRFLTKISDIEKKTDDGIALYYFIKGGDDKFAKPMELKVSNIDELINIDEVSSVEDISMLISQDDNGNLHHRDRLSFFKLALVDTLKKLILQDTSGHTEMEILFRNFDKIKNAYYEHYDVFIHNFAIGEFQQQVEEKGFDYGEKISAVLNDIQVRLYAIPIVLVSLGALAKVDDIYSYFFIISGVMITALFNYWMINDQILRLKHIEKSSSFAFDKLKTLGSEKLESKDVLKNLDEIVCNIQRRIADRNTKITYYKIFCWLPTCITFILLLIKERDDLGRFLRTDLMVFIDNIYCLLTGFIKILLSFFSLG